MVPSLNFVEKISFAWARGVGVNQGGGYLFPELAATKPPEP